jgi:hypothetical protein
MKKFLLYAAFAVTILTLHAQTEPFVATVPTDKNAVIEEYTGVNCINCPDGHLIANRIAEVNPGRVIVLNIHAGSFAANTYTTDEGTVLQTTFGVASFPKATVNRHSFSGFPDDFALSRTHWTAATDTILNQPSPVNIAARGTLDWTTRELNITVQLYYTSDEADSTNLLNVAILQNNVIGEQDGYYYNPQQVVGNQYRHMHMLRHLVTGQWGDSIHATTAGSFVEKNYTFTIPETMGAPNPIEAKLEDLSFVAFVAQGQREILTCCEVEMENVNLPSTGARLKEIDHSVILDCSDNTAINAIVKNIGAEPIASLTFEYSINNGENSIFHWAGQITSLDTARIMLPMVTVTPNANQTASVNLIAVNGQDIDGGTFSTVLKKMVAEGSGTMSLHIKTDGHARELSFKIYNSENEIIIESSPEQFTNNSVCEFPLTLPEEGCYHLEISDAGGDGITSGYIRLYNASNQIILNATGNSFASVLHGMISYETTGIDDMTAEDSFLIFPNPASGIINIRTEYDIQMVEIYNLQGQRVAVGNRNANSISVSNLSKGVYIMKITTEQGIRSCKIDKE